MRINILVFGILTDIIGTNKLEFEDIESVSILKEKLFIEYPKLKAQNFKISVNKKFIVDDLKLYNNDEVALLPPFSGG